MELTVKDLIQALSKYPPNTRVLVQGYEGGYSDVQDAREIPVAFNVNKEDYMGPHDDDENSKQTAIVLIRDLNRNK